MLLDTKLSDRLSTLLNHQERYVTLPQYICRKAFLVVERKLKSQAKESFDKFQVSTNSPYAHISLCTFHYALCTHFNAPTCTRKRPKDTSSLTGVSRPPSKRASRRLFELCK